MASESRPSDQGGYDYHFVETPPDELVCMICTFVARDPQQLVCCGRVFCRECLSKLKRNSSPSTCPHCRRVSPDGFNDARSDRNIKSLKVKCNNLGRGCEWTGELRSAEEHHSTCDFSLIQCPNHCMKDGKDVTLLRNKLSDHLETDCPKRPYECPHCKETGEYQERTTSHLEACPQLETACPNSPCTAHPLNCDLDEHRSVCEYEKVACKYAGLGCQEHPQRKEVSVHESDLKRHISIAMTTIQTLKDSNEQSCLTPYHFKVDEFDKRKKNKAEFYSKPFYTHPGGYRLCVNVCPNGDGDGENTHVSVFIHLMKGQNDDNLSWPFLGTVTVSLLNQLEDKNHYVINTKFDSEHYGARVQGNEEKGAGFGRPEFISHTDLISGPHRPLFSGQRPTGGLFGLSPSPMMTLFRNCQYLKDDCLYFRVTSNVDRKWLFSA